jgi:LuxR family transcriptional regulator, maltose regulon positive regulatory protein
MSYRIPRVYSNQPMQSDEVLSIPSVGSKDWYAWLERQQAFCFEADYGSFIVRKKKRSGRFYWYTYYRSQGKLYTAYLGKSEKLTLNRLNEVMQTLRKKTEQVVTTRMHQSNQETTLSHDWGRDLLMLTKLCIPPVHRHIISRVSLLERLNEGMDRKLTIISASAGFGKTILLSEWATCSPWIVAWISLDRSDNDPTRFWEYLITALRKVQPALGEHVIMLLRTPQAIAIEAVLTVLINEITLIEQDFALVLDDYEVISSSEIHQAMNFLLDHLPQRMHLFIASRIDLPFPLTRLRARRHLLELYTADLRLTSDEIKNFFAQRTHIPLSAETLAILASRTEGWITGLELVALSLQKCADLLAFIDAFSGNDSYVLDYLANEVFQQQSEEIQAFLLDTSILDHLNSSLCDALALRNDSQYLLEQLEKTNIFTFLLDNRQINSQKRWYRYHNMFRDFLQDYLHRYHAHRVDVLYLRACDWYESAGLLKEAVRYALAAKDFNKAARLISQIGQMMIRQNEVATLLQWLGVLPEEVMSSFPHLCLLQAWLLMITGKLHLVEKWLRYSQSWLEKKQEDVSTQPLQQQEDVRKIRGMLATFRAHIAAFQGDIPATIASANLALANLPEEDDFLRSLNALNLGAAYWLNEDIVAATQAFAQARKSSQKSDNLYVILIALCCLAHVCIARGQLRQAFKLAQQALQLTTERNCDLWWAVAGTYTCISQLFCEWNDLDNALLYAEKGLTLSKQAGYQDMLAYSYTMLAKTKQAQGKVEEARQILEQEETSLQHHPRQSWIVASMATTHIRLSLMQGNMERVNAWQPDNMCNYVHIFEMLTLVRIYIAKERLDDAYAILYRKMVNLVHKDHISIHIEMHLLKALVYYHRQMLDQAVLSLEDALELAEPEGYLRLIVSEGLPIAKILAEIVERRLKGRSQIARTFSLEYIQRLLAACEPLTNGTGQVIEDFSSKGSQLPDQLLTKRELEIMRFVVVGMSNREISEKIFISEHTVKWYVKSIYSKIGVHNRAQAVVRANELHLWS